MTQIEVPDWVVEAALLASFRVACEHTGKEFSDDEFRNARDEHDRENRNVASEMMKAAIIAALGAWVVPAHFATDGAGDVPVFEEFTELDQAYAHAGDDGWVVEAYALRQEKPE